MTSNHQLLQVKRAQATGNLSKPKSSTPSKPTSLNKKRLQLEKRLLMIWKLCSTQRNCWFKTVAELYKTQMPKLTMFFSTMDSTTKFGRKLLTVKKTIWIVSLCTLGGLNTAQSRKHCMITRMYSFYHPCPRKYLYPNLRVLEYSYVASIIRLINSFSLTLRLYMDSKWSIISNKQNTWFAYQSSKSKSARKSKQF